MKWQAIFLERGSCLGWTWCAGCWPISRLFSRIHGAIVSRERRSLGGGPDAPRCIARGERRGGWRTVHGGTIRRGNSTESWAKAKGSAAAAPGDSDGTHAAAPIVLRFWEAEALPISERSGANIGSRGPALFLAAGDNSADATTAAPPCALPVHGDSIYRNYRQIRPTRPLSIRDLLFNRISCERRISLDQLQRKALCWWGKNLALRTEVLG